MLPGEAFDHLYSLVTANWMVGLLVLLLLAHIAAHIACGILVVAGAVLPSWMFVRHGGTRGLLFVAMLWVLALRIAYH